MMKTLYVLLCITVMLALTACDRETVIRETVGPQSCAECHDPSNVITGKATQWAESVHGTGESYGRGTSASCAGCHSGNGFAEMVAAGQNPGSVPSGDPDPTRQDCRACHMIHETYTDADFALRTVDAVALYAISGATFNGGEGNLCVNCHQPRRIFPEPVNDTITGISEHWGPHHGPQSAMMLGKAGAGVTGTAHGHYGGVANTCVTCHMGDEANHTFEPAVSRCKGCHPDIANYNASKGGVGDFDYKFRQTEIIALIDSLGEELLAAGLINENTEDGHPTVTKAQYDKAIALWNWIYVAHEDKSEGVHNYGYAKALLEEGLARLAAVRQAPAGSQASK